MADFSMNCTVFLPMVDALVITTLGLAASLVSAGCEVGLGFMGVC